MMKVSSTARSFFPHVFREQRGEGRRGVYYFRPVHAEILHQDLWLPDERARLRTGRALAYRPRL